MNLSAEQDSISAGEQLGSTDTGSLSEVVTKSMFLLPGLPGNLSRVTRANFSFHNSAHADFACLQWHALYR